jgi:hypothetical protein
MNLSRVLNYSALESIGSRVFDFVTLWIVINTLPVDDLAKFGIATAAIFIFNSFLLTPETSLFKFQKNWIKDKEITQYLSAFVSFSTLKISLHYLFSLLVYLIVGEMNWFFYAVIFSAITQQIQAAETARIYMRMELKQKKVALFEIKSKFVLTILALALFYKPNIELYFLIYFFWSIIVTFIWLRTLKKDYSFVFEYNKKSWLLIWCALKGFSIWTHFSGIATLFIYNSSLLFLGWFSYSNADIALYTVINKVANLFFVIPMFLQSIVPVVLSNAGLNKNKQFNKVFLISLLISFSQLMFFVFLGKHLGMFFGLNEEDAQQFFDLGLIISMGIFLLNATRPFSTYLFIKSSPSYVMLTVFIPVVVLALILYPLLLDQHGLVGISYAMMIVFTFLAALLTINFWILKRKEI